MKKKILFIIMVITCFMLTGCLSKNKNTESYINVQQINEKKIQVEVSNLKKGEEKSATLELSEGEDIVITYNMEGLKGLDVETFALKDGNRQSMGSELIIGEDGNSTISELEPGTYEFVFSANQNGVTGALTITAKANEN